ncbi:MAG: YqhA family protein [Pseudomonadota bacterium]
MSWQTAERKFLRATRMLTVAAVVASFAGALLMFWLGLSDTWRAFSTQLQPEIGPLKAGDRTVIYLIGALDRFLIAIVLLFFGYGIHVLFVRPTATPRQLGLPEWLHVESIGQLKQTLAEVIIIVLFVLFLRVALQTFSEGVPELSWQGLASFLLLPLSILLLAFALKNAELHPKPLRPSEAWRPPSDNDRLADDQSEGGAASAAGKASLSALQGEAAGPQTPPLRR